MRSLFFNFLNILFFCLFTISISAQPNEDGPVSSLGTVTNDGEGMNTALEFCLNDDNQLIAKVEVLLGGLQIMGSSPNYYGVIPAGYDDMHVEFTINGVISYVPVGDFDIITLQPSGNLAFSFIAESPAMDFSNECANSDVGIISVSVHFRLVTTSDNGYSTYPACDYPNMFSCYIYTYAPWCDSGVMPMYDIPGDPSESCYDEWFEGGYSAKVHCDCDFDTTIPPDEDDHTIDGHDYFDGDNGNINNRYVLDNNIIAYPNPMGELLQIESNVESIKQIELYNSRGDLIIKNIYKGIETHNVSLNTSEIPRGLYLAKITTESGIQVIKVLK